MVDAASPRFALAFRTVLLVGFLLSLGGSIASAQDNLVPNGDFTESIGNSLRYWQHDVSDQPIPVTFDWLADDNPPEIEVWNQAPWDARWTQTLELQPGWYHFTASIRTEGVGGANTVGATLSLMESWILSKQVVGTTDWQTVGFYLNVHDPGAEVVLACRLGFYSAMNGGKAFFRDVNLTKVDGPIAGGDPSFDMSQCWHHQPE